MNIKDHKFETEITDNFQVKFIPSPNIYSTLTPKKLIIHYTESPHAKSAIDTFIQNNKPSAHLIIARDGKDVTQMVPFDKRAKHMAYPKNNFDSIGIELDYPGYLTEKPHSFKHLNDYPADKRLHAHIKKGPKRLQIWPLYPAEQMETLYQICQKLIEEFPDIDTIEGHEDLEDKTDPGPAFPITYFREKLLGDKVPGQVLWETSQAVELRTSPKEDHHLISGGSLTQNKRVAIVDEKQYPEFALIEVMEPENGNKWLVGWVPKSHLQIRKYQIVIKDHSLFGQDENQQLDQFSGVRSEKRKQRRSM